MSAAGAVGNVRVRGGTQGSPACELADRRVCGCVRVQAGGDGFLRIRVLEPDSCVTEEVCVATSCAKIVTEFFGCQLVGGVAVLKTLTAVTGAGLTSHWARKCVLTLLLSWPADVPFTLAKIGGTDGLVALAKMVSSCQDIFGQLRDELGSSLGGASPVVDGLRARIMWIIGQEGVARSWAGMTYKCSLCTLLNDGEDEACTVCGTPRPPMQADTEKLSDTLVTECMASLLTATAVRATTHVTKQSSHPAAAGRVFRSSVQVADATALWISFDPRCCTLDAKGSSLSFFADDRRDRLLAAFSGPPQNFQPFVVYSDRVFYTFSTAPNDAASWGFQFTARPISGLRWLRESEVLTQPSLEWACWLLAFLLTDVLPQLRPGALHTSAVFEGAVAFLQTPDVPFKHRLIKLLTQLLSTPEHFSGTDRIDLNRLDGILYVSGVLPCTALCVLGCELTHCHRIVVWCNTQCCHQLGGAARQIGEAAVPHRALEAVA